MYLSSTFVELESRKEPTDKFGEECSSSEQCDYEKGYCLEGTCACVIGFSFNFTIRQCVEKCSAYGDTFSCYKTFAIDGCNTEHYEMWGMKGMSCTEVCLANTEITCVSAEYHTQQSCNLCDRTLNTLDPEDLEHNEPSYELCFRNCKEE